MRESKSALAKTQVISLFSGAGGLDIGFSQAGFDVAFAADYDAAAVETYNHNAKVPVAHEVNLLNISNEQFQLMLKKEVGKGAYPRGIIGGPPCQGFSRANVARSGDDPRNKLAMRYANLVLSLSDRYPIDFFVFENVPEIRAKKNEDFLKRLRERLALEFTMFESELNAHDFLVPQLRKRYFIVGFRKKLRISEFRFPAGYVGAGGTVRDAIHGLPEPTYFNRLLSTECIPYHPNHWTMQPRSSRFGSDMPSGGRSFIQLEWNKPSRTVAYGNREIHVHPDSHRRLSIYEAMLLQGFPHSYELKGNLSQQVTQVSNAVPPPLAREIAKSIRSALRRRNIGSSTSKAKRR